MKSLGGTIIFTLWSSVEAITLKGATTAKANGKKGGALPPTSMASQNLPHVDGYFPFALDPSTVATHTVAMWRQETDYYTKFSYKNPKTGKVSFNSCMDKEVSAQDVCSSRGICMPFDKTDAVNPTFFCKCYVGWAGPECSIKQKSQTTAWLYSLFLGFVGADEYYLEETFWCGLKLFGLATGSLLYWMDWPHIGVILVLSYWLYDIVRLGSAAVHTKDAKVAADLPHWAFTCWTLVFFAFVAFCMGISKVYWAVKAKRRKADMSNFYFACDAYGSPIDVPNVDGVPLKYARKAAYGANWSGA